MVVPVAMAVFVVSMTEIGADTEVICSEANCAVCFNAG